MAQHTGPDSPLSAGFSEMMKTNSEHMGTWAKSYGTAFEKFGKVNEETFDFWARRLKADFEMPAKLARCHEPQEIADTCSRFFAKMINDYNEQANKVVVLMSDAVEESLTAAQNGQNEQSTSTPKQKTKPSAQS